MICPFGQRAFGKELHGFERGERIGMGAVFFIASLVTVFRGVKAFLRSKAVEVDTGRTGQGPEPHEGGDEPADAVPSPAELARRAATRLLEQAAAAEPEVTGALQSNVGERGGQMLGLENRLKTLDSLARKIENEMRTTGISADEAAARMKDVLRYTASFPTERLAAEAQSTLDALRARGYTAEVGDVKNYWQEGNPYKGLNVAMQAPNGQPFELQFHTPESYELKTASHADYEIVRDPSQPLEARQAAYDRMVGQSASLPTPPGIETVGTPRSNPRPE